ncbi:DNA translocase FtsK, partial [Massilia sp.]|uniref:DNA translocase FtsK n=1 Tax=Massilia sp. TaxID=1882437 RepID=UPI0028B1A0F4
MSSEQQVLAQMVESGISRLPPTPLITTGKFRRFGKDSKGWYILRELELDSGKTVLTGAFGWFQGENRNTVPVKVDAEAMSPEDRQAYKRKLREAEKAEEEKRQREIRLAANRARDQWNKAAGVPVAHPYLERKQVPAEGVRVGHDGMLLIPLVRDGQLLGLQKISAAGVKKLNAGMDAIGVMHVLGQLDGAPVIALGEGYATCASARLALAPGYDLPVVVALNAGNLIHAARWLRKHYPTAHLLFLADDDYLLAERFARLLQDEFKISSAPPIDGTTHRLVADDGETVDVMATWRVDINGIRYISTDIRRGRAVSSPTFSNAGVSSCHAAAREVGNASVAIPLFAIDRAGRKLTDFNDLHIEEGLDKVAAQIGVSLLAAEQRNVDSLPVPVPAQAAEVVPQPVAVLSLAAQQRNTEPFAPSAPAAAQAPQSGPILPFAAQQRTTGSPAPSPEETPDDSDALYDQAVAVVLANRRASISLVQRHLRVGYNRAARLLEQMEAGGVVSPMQSNGNRDILIPDSPLPPGAEQPRASATGETPAEIAARFDEEAAGSGSKTPPVGVRSAPGEGGDDEATHKKDKPKKVYGQAHWDAVDDVLENFILIYGEDLVWDCRQRMLMKVSAMRTIVANNDVMKFWSGESRKWVLKKNIVFDPTETPSPAKSGPTATVNLFSGWKMRPKKGNCMQIQVLLSHLCDGNDDLATWILRWLAYPLRNPGAKMETSIIMHGDEGSGKNFFFEKVVKAIYGEYGYVIGNAQLESNFNDWASMKLFMVADEVVTRAELKQMKGKLKYLVSGDTVIVNPKGLPEHSEANQ